MRERPGHRKRDAGFGDVSGLNSPFLPLLFRWLSLSESGYVGGRKAFTFCVCVSVSVNLANEKKSVCVWETCKWERRNELDKRNEIQKQIESRHRQVKLYIFFLKSLILYANSIFFSHSQTYFFYSFALNVVFPSCEPLESWDVSCLFLTLSFKRSIFLTFFHSQPLFLLQFLSFLSCESLETRDLCCFLSSLSQTRYLFHFLTSSVFPQLVSP